MVRMDHPSPFQVGREFVRQYYSLLNKAPEILHRFYGVHSSYVHGSKYLNGEPEEEVVGQTEIHKKITSLQFKECHTKVYQVDAHSTIGNGVVVQVVGELSNNRKPLRRFMQTFVLAPQGDNPYKFYVHNDIFRYEDEVYHDELPSERAEEQGSEVEEEQPEDDRQPSHFENHVVVPSQPQHVVNNGIEQHLDSPVNADSGLSPTPTTSPPNLPAADTPPLEPAHEPPAPVEPEPRVTTPDFPAIDEKREPQFDMAERDVDDSDNNVTVKESESGQVFSWAALASKNTPVQHNIQQGTVVKVSQPQDSSMASIDQQQKPQPRSVARPPPAPQRDDSGDGPGDSGVRRGIRYPDNQQIFVGNLPYEIMEADLREHFSNYGEIIDVRINHSNTSNPSFGFIIFEDPKSVEEVLHLMPTTFKNNKRINIEEKKQRAMSRDGRRGGPGGWDARRDNNRGGGRVQQRGPPRRDWGGPREGQRPNNFQSRR